MVRYLGMESLDPRDVGLPVLSLPSLDRAIADGVHAGIVLLGVALNYPLTGGAIEDAVEG